MWISATNTRVSLRNSILHPNIRTAYFSFANNVKCNHTRGTSERLTKFLVGKPEGNRPLRRPRFRREDNIKVGLAGIASGCGVFVCVSVLRVVTGCYGHGNVTSDIMDENFLKSLRK
jgi:hypothetical protein